MKKTIEYLKQRAPPTFFQQYLQISTTFFGLFVGTVTLSKHFKEQDLKKEKKKDNNITMDLEKLSDRHKRYNVHEMNHKISCYQKKIEKQREKYNIFPYSLFWSHEARDWADIWLERRNQNDPEAKEIEFYRIQLKGFFYHVKEVYEKNPDRLEVLKNFMTDDPIQEKCAMKFLRLVSPLDKARIKAQCHNENADLLQQKTSILNALDVLNEKLRRINAEIDLTCDENLTPDSNDVNFKCSIHNTFPTPPTDFEFTTSFETPTNSSFEVSTTVNSTDKIAITPPVDFTSSMNSDFTDDFEDFPDESKCKTENVPETFNFHEDCLSILNKRKTQPVVLFEEPSKKLKYSTFTEATFNSDEKKQIVKNPNSWGSEGVYVYTICNFKKWSTENQNYYLQTLIIKQDFYQLITGKNKVMSHFKVSNDRLKKLSEIMWSNNGVPSKVNHGNVGKFESGLSDEDKSMIKTFVLSFDYKQNVALPVMSCQADLLYYKSKLNVNLFGIVDEKNMKLDGVKADIFLWDERNGSKTVNEIDS
eukprot:gene8343-166_t